MARRIAERYRYDAKTRANPGCARRHAGSDLLHPRLRIYDRSGGALTRRRLERDASELERQATSERYSAIIIDADEFKRINDTYGHAVGDQAIAAYVVRGCIRSHDRVYRYGGDEFLVLLPRTGIDVALTIAERIRSHVETNSSVSGIEGKLIGRTVSVAVAECATGERYDELFDRLDKSLYEAKRGRNRVIESSP